jgi:hypothetical protein
MWCWGASAGWWMPVGLALIGLFVLGLAAIGAWLIVTLAKRSSS